MLDMLICRILAPIGAMFLLATVAIKPAVADAPGPNLRNSNNPPQGQQQTPQSAEGPRPSNQSPLQQLVDQKLFDPSGDELGSIYDVLLPLNAPPVVVVVPKQPGQLLVMPITYLSQTQAKWTLALSSKTFVETPKMFTSAPERTMSIRTGSFLPPSVVFLSFAANPSGTTPSNSEAQTPAFLPNAPFGQSNSIARSPTDQIVDPYNKAQEAIKNLWRP